MLLRENILNASNPLEESLKDLGFDDWLLKSHSISLNLITTITIIPSAFSIYDKLYY
jgi:hypothetical protein